MTSNGPIRSKERKRDNKGTVMKSFFQEYDNVMNEMISEYKRGGPKVS